MAHINNDDPMFVGLFIGALGLLLLTKIVAYCLLNAIESSKKRIYNLFLEIPSTHLKGLHSMCEKFVVEVQYGQGQDKASAASESENKEDAEEETKEESDILFSKCKTPL